MLRCVIFDFNGLIIDDEEEHYKAFAKTLEREGLPLARDEYFEHYLGLDDKGCFAAVLADKRQEFPPIEEIMRLVEQKAEDYMDEIRNGVTIFPGIEDLIRRLNGEVFLAIASGARKHEIEHVIGLQGWNEYFKTVVSADEVSNGKPDPEGYLKAFERLTREADGAADLKASECLVLEDAPNGINAAHSAGMACIAVTNSRERKDLHEADFVVDSVEELTIEKIRQVVSSRRS